MKQDYYSVLGLTRKASAEDIQKAYRALALRYHPDRNDSRDASARMTAINEAYEVLGDARRRREYDRQTTQPAPPVELSSAILAAARDLILRAGWRVVEDNGRSLLLENNHNRVCIVFVNLLDEATMRRAERETPGFSVVLAAVVDVRMESGPASRVSVAGFDLVHGSRYGAPFPDGMEGPCRSLLSPFL